MSLTGRVRTEVAVGTPSEVSMFSTRRRAGPRIGVASAGTAGDGARHDRERGSVAPAEVGTLRPGAGR